MKHQDSPTCFFRKFLLQSWPRRVQAYQGIFSVFLLPCHSSLSLKVSNGTDSSRLQRYLAWTCRVAALVHYEQSPSPGSLENEDSLQTVDTGSPDLSPWNTAQRQRPTDTPRVWLCGGSWEPTVLPLFSAGPSHAAPCRSDRQVWIPFLLKANCNYQRTVRNAGLLL